MLLTLNANCVRGLLQPSVKGRRPSLSIGDLPAFTRETLGLSGLALTTDLLVGYDRQALEAFRERADKAGCSCLLLIESDPQPLAELDSGEASVARMRRVVQAANLLGCNSAAVRIKAADNDGALEIVAKRLRQISEPAEKIEVTLLIAPSSGLTCQPERLTDLIKKVGGFRIGTFPDLQTAGASKEPAVYLRRLCPYAAVVSASTVKFVECDTPAPPGPEGRPGALQHEPYALPPLIKAVASVGYEGTLAIDYRGEGDVTLGISRSRDALQAALDLLDMPAQVEEPE